MNMEDVFWAIISILLLLIIFRLLEWLGRKTKVMTRDTKETIKYRIIEFAIVLGILTWHWRGNWLKAIIFWGGFRLLGYLIGKVFELWQKRQDKKEEEAGKKFIEDIKNRTFKW